MKNYMAIFGDCHIGFDKACAQRPPVNSAIDKIHHVSISMLGTLCEKKFGPRNGRDGL